MDNYIDAYIDNNILVIKVIKNIPNDIHIVEETLDALDAIDIIDVGDIDLTDTHNLLVANQFDVIYSISLTKLNKLKHKGDSIKLSPYSNMDKYITIESIKEDDSLMDFAMWWYNQETEQDLIDFLT